LGMDQFVKDVDKTVIDLARWLDDNDVEPVVAATALMRACAIVTVASSNATDAQMMEAWRLCIVEVREQLEQAPKATARWHKWWRM